MTDQEIVALTLVACAGAFLVRKLTGWPRKKASEGPKALVSSRLQRGLRSAEERKEKSGGCH